MRKECAGFVCSLLIFGCGDKDPTVPPTTEPRIVERTDRDQWGLITCSEATEDRTCFTHRSIIGISMGAGGAGQVGFKRPDLFDSVGLLGFPGVDFTYLLRNVERGYLGGFCDRDQILANMGELSNPDGPAFCGPVTPTERMEPSGRVMEGAQDFNHWYRWIDEGRGGNFGRNKLRESFQDLSLAFGNPGYYNPDSPYLPPGVPREYLERSDEDRCATPHVIQGLKHKEYNPDGTHDVIVVCDTRTNDGEFNPARPSEESFEMLLAVDYNQNGMRDFAEPALYMAKERFEDIGLEPGDTYDFETNPTGKAGNWLHDEGEPFEDTGLDGVPGTGDYGEGNGKYDYSPNLDNWFAHSPRQLVEKMEPGQLDRLHIWADAGIRDFLGSAGATNWFFGALQGLTSKDVARDYTSFFSLVDTPEYDFLSLDFEDETKFGKHVYVRYGDPNAEQRDIDRGDGHHVGPADQVLNRFLTSLHYIQSRFYERDTTAVEVEDILGLVTPATFRSAALDEVRNYGIILPPGYDLAENADKRYPVVYFLHGQGQEADDLLAASLFFFGYQGQSSREERRRSDQSDWAKFIIVFPDSRCHREECGGGNFNSNHKGLFGEGPRFEDSLFELFKHIEDNYRVGIPIEVPREKE